MRSSYVGRVGLAFAAAVAVLVGCTTGPTLPPATAGPTASAPPDFTLEVLPELSVGRTIGGQPVVFLVVVGGSPSAGPVEITATAEGAAAAVEPEALAAGAVGEVQVVPQPVAGEESLVVTIAGNRGNVERSESRTLTLVEGEDGLADEAAARLEPFMAWLAASRPELGLTPETELEGTPGSWVLVVNHYVYFSDAWEIDLAWHVMIAPDDWARIDLRRRWTESQPSRAFEISSVTGGGEPHETAPAEDVWR
jgi:hypothetical protein